MNEKDVKIYIVKLFKEMFNKELTEKEYGVNFFSRQINIMPFELVYLIYKIEEKYNIKFNESELSSEYCYNVQTLSNMILNKSTH